jgi:Tfp pilus assembly protein PilZ
MNRQNELPAPPPIVGRALLVSNDSIVVRQLTNSLRQFAISVDVCGDLTTAAGLVNTRKFEAVVVDLALGEQVAHVLERVRFSPSNQNSVTFVLADSHERPDYRIHPNFVMEKPLTDSMIGSTLKAALGLIIRDYRRYFRCPVGVPTVVHFGGLQISCTMINISEGGLAVQTQAALKPGTAVRAEFTLPGEPVAFDIDAEVCWCDNRGRAGIQFRAVSSGQQFLLQSWLSRRIEQSLPEPIARLFQKTK